MRISQKHIQYILLLLIVVIAVCAYQFGYVKYIEKADSVKSENAQIEARINELNQKESHREEWTNGIAQSEKDVRILLAKYGPGNTPEKSIMFIKSLEDTAEMSIPNISFSADNPIYISNDYDASGKPLVQMNGTSLAFTYNTTYLGLKKAMDYINNYSERMNVNNFSASFNQETGQLTGNMILNLFSVSDENHIYVAPRINGIDIGTDNIFGTIDFSNLLNGLEDAGAEGNTENPIGESSTPENTEGGESAATE